MIKGINRQVIEVADTGSEYFERAMLFVSPGFSETERHILEREAKKNAAQDGGTIQNEAPAQKLVLGSPDGGVCSGGRSSCGTGYFLLLNRK